VRVVDSEQSLVTFQSFIDPSAEKEAKCLGYLSTLYGNDGYKGTCVIPPYGSAVFLNASKDSSPAWENPQIWKLDSSNAEYSFHIYAWNKPAPCLRSLAVENCRTRPVLVESPVKFFTQSQKYDAWRLTRVYNISRAKFDSVIFTLKYTGSNVTPETFTAEDRKQVCENILTLQPGGDCKILSVVQGSVIVTGYVEYDQGVDALDLTETLRNSNAEVDAVLTQDLSLATNVTVDVAQPVPSIQSGSVPAPIDVIATANNGSCPSAAIDISFRLPQDASRENVLGYAATCTTSAGSSTVTAAHGPDTSSTITITVNGLKSLTMYMCEVRTVGNQGGSAATASSPTTTGCAGSPPPPPSPVPPPPVPSPSPSPSPINFDRLPGKPGSLQLVSVGTVNLSIGWDDGDRGIPHERYVVSCGVSGSSSCQSSSNVKSNEVDRGVQSAEVDGLQSNTMYDCWVQAINALGVVCSDSSVQATTYLLPGAPSKLSSCQDDTTSATVSWTDGALGTPQQTYKVRCFTQASGSQCTDANAIESAAVSPGVGKATVSGLTSGTPYQCWVVAENAAGTTCSADSVLVSQPFFLSCNGVTVKCPSASDLATGRIGGVKYTKRTWVQVRTLAKIQMTWGQLATTCTSGITTFDGLFDYSKYGQSYGFFGTFNEDISTWDTSSVTTMASMFISAFNFNKPIGDWDTSQVVSMQSMFKDTKNFNQPLNAWDVSKVGSMNSMFNQNPVFNQPLDKWDTSSVESMDSMFSITAAFNQPLNAWNTSKVTSMKTMFKEASAFDQPLNQWDTGKVTNMQEMFSKATSYNQDLTGWQVGQVTQCLFFSFGATSWSSSNQPTSFTCALAP